MSAAHNACSAAYSCRFQGLTKTEVRSNCRRNNFSPIISGLSSSYPLNQEPEEERMKTRSRPPPNDKRFWETVFGEADESSLGPQPYYFGLPAFSEKTPLKDHSSRPLRYCLHCVYGEGWAQCGHCCGSGRYITKPGLAGVKDKVGVARCKVCFGRTVVPCFICGLPDPTEWHEWRRHARRWPIKHSQGQKQ